MVWEQSKICFQDGGYGGHSGFPIGMILAIFHLHINLLLHCKFQLNLRCGLREDVQTDFQDGSCRSHLGFLNDMILAHLIQKLSCCYKASFCSN